MDYYTSLNSQTTAITEPTVLPPGSKPDSFGTTLRSRVQTPASPLNVEYIQNESANGVFSEASEYTYINRNRNASASTLTEARNSNSNFNANLNKGNGSAGKCFNKDTGNSTFTYSFRPSLIGFNDKGYHNNRYDRIQEQEEKERKFLASDFNKPLSEYSSVYSNGIENSGSISSKRYSYGRSNSYFYNGTTDMHVKNGYTEGLHNGNTRVCDSTLISTNGKGNLNGSCNNEITINANTNGNIKDGGSSEIDEFSDYYKQYRNEIYENNAISYESKLAVVEESLICITFINNMRARCNLADTKFSNEVDINDGLAIENISRRKFPKSTSLGVTSLEQYRLSDEGKNDNINNNYHSNISSFEIDNCGRSYSEPNTQITEIKSSKADSPAVTKRASFSVCMNNSNSYHKIPGIHEGCLSAGDREYLHQNNKKGDAPSSPNYATATDIISVSHPKHLNTKKKNLRKSKNRIVDLLNEDSHKYASHSVTSIFKDDMKGIIISDDDDLDRGSNIRIGNSNSSGVGNPQPLLQQQILAINGKPKNGNKKKSPKALKQGICVQCGVRETTQWRTINVYREGKVCNSCGMFSNKLDSMFGKVATNMILQKKKLDGTSSERKMSNILKEYNDIIEQFGKPKK